MLDASNVFARFRAVVPATGQAASIPVTLSPADFTMPGSRVVVGFRVESAAGGLDPAAVTVRTASGAVVSPTYVNADLGGKAQSLALFSLGFASYQLAVSGEHGTSGEFRLDAFLAGDADGNHAIDLADGARIRALDGSIAGDGRYLVEADANLDGKISSFDYTQWRYNVGAATRIAPLSLSLGTPAGVVTLPSGSLATRNATGLLPGQTASGASLALESGSDGGFDDGSAVANPAGGFGIAYTLAAGDNTLQVRATDGFGQSQSASLGLLLDASAPVIQLSTPTAGLLTRTNPTFAGKVTDDLTGVASLTASLDGGPATSVTFDASGNFSFATPLPLDHTADGVHTVRLIATDRVGNASAALDRSFTLDTAPPVVTVTSPTSGATVDRDVTLQGVVTDVTAGVASLQVALDGGAYAAVPFDASGHFAVAAGLAVDGSADGPHTFHVKATDLAGNTSAVTDVPFTLKTAATGETLTERTDFEPAIRRSIVVPSSPSMLTVKLAGPTFDTSSTGRAKDAFEVALVDASGRSLVPTIAAGRDAFFNLTEGQVAAVGAWAKWSGDTITLDLSQVTPGTAATLILRLVNNDGDTTTTVRIAQVAVGPLVGSPVGPGGQPAAASSQSSASIDFAHLADVSASVRPAYGRTSFDEAAKVLYADLAAKNSGSYAVESPLIVAIAHLSDPTVRVRGADGTTPEGLPYFDLSTLVSGGLLAPGGTTAARTISFANPSGKAFTYDLVFLGHLNTPPAFTSTPGTEAVAGKPYAYRAAASDTEGDALAFSIVSGPAGLAIDAATGLVTWSPAANDVGTADVTIAVADGHGGTATQRFTLATIAPPPNRPPVFTSTPVVSANVDITTMEVMYGSSRDIQGASQLILVQGFNSSTPVVKAIGSMGVVVGDLAGTDDGVLYAATFDGVYAVDTKNGSLATLVAAQIRGNSLAWAQTNVLYSWSYDRATISSYDLKTHAIRTVASLSDSGADLAWDPTQNVLYAVSLSDRLYRIDPATGEVRTIGTLDLGGLAPSISFDRSGQLYTGGGAQGSPAFRLYRTDKANASSTLLADFSPSNLGLYGLGNAVVPGSSGISYAYQANAIDPDSDPLTYSLPEHPSGMIVNSATGLITWAPRAEQVGINEVVLNVSDGHGGTATQAFSIDVRPAVGNHPPAIVSTPPTEVVVSPSRVLASSDFDSDSEGWKSVTLKYPQAGSPPAVLGTYNPTFVATGGSPGGSIRIDDPDGSLSVGNTQYWSASSKFLGDMSAAYGGILSFSLAQSPTNDPFSQEDVILVGGGLTLVYDTSSNPATGWTGYSVGLFEGGWRRDSLSGPAATRSDMRTVLSSLSALYIRGEFQLGPDTEWFDSVALTAFQAQMVYDVAAVDPDGDALTYSLARHPLGMTIDPASGEISWVVAPSLQGAQAVTVRVDDGRGGFDEQSFAVDVASSAGRGEIRGTAFEDVNGNGRRDSSPVLTPAYSEDFESAAAGPEWSLRKVDITPGTAAHRADRFLGQFGNQTQTLTLSGLPGHDTVHVEFDLYIIRTWDGNGTLYPGPDVWDLRVVGGPTLLHTTFRLPYSGEVPAEVQSYPDPYPGGRYLGGTGAAENRTLGYSWGGTPNLDSVYHLSFDIPHTSGSIVLAFSASNLQDLSDESWGLDNVVVATSRIVSEPALPGWTVYLDQNANGRRDEGEQSTTTDADGNYALRGLLSGVYHVAMEPKPGWTQTSPTSGATPGQFDVEVGAGQIVTGIDFGNMRIVDPGPNRSPRFVTTAPASAAIGWRLRYDARATDPDRDPLTYDLVVRPDGMAVDPASGILVWTPTAEQIGTFDAILRVQDGRGGVDLQAIRITVPAPNTAPVITSSPRGPAAVGSLYRYAVKAIDPDQDPITFRLGMAPDGMTVDPITGILSWIPTEETSSPELVMVVAGDGRGGEAPQFFYLTVVAGLPNADPTITSSPPTSARLGGRYAYRVEADDPNGDTLTYELSVAPAGMTIGAETGLVAWEPLPGQFGPNDVTVRVRDGRGGLATQGFTVEVSTLGQNHAPAIVSTPILSGVAGAAYRYDAKADDSDGDTVVWSLDTAPQGLAIDASTGALRWTPGAAQIGSQAVVIRATDTQGASSTQSFTVVVRAVNSPPNVTSVPSTTAAEDRAYRYQVVAIDADGDPLSYALTTFPSGMTIDATTGLITWTPVASQLGAQAVAVRVEDGRGGVGTQAFIVEARPAGEDLPPIITSTPGYVASVGSPYRYAVTASDPENQPLTFSLLTFPTGMTIDAATGVISWTPTAGQMPSTTVVVAAEDPAGNVAGQRFTISVRAANRAPSIASTPVSSVTAGLTYRYDLRATDPDGDSLAYRLASAPAGMTIDTVGRITWKTTVANVGKVAAEVVVSDGRGGEVSQPFTLTVAADTEVPMVTLVASPNPTNLGADATLTVAFTDNVGVTGLRLMFDGQAVAVDSSGRATVKAARVGLVPAVATVTDAAGNVGTASVQVSVIDTTDADAPIASITSPGDDVVITSAVSVIGTASDSKLVEYTLELQPVDGGDAVVIARGTSSVTDGVLGTLDPARFGNDSYILRLVARDAGGHTATDERLVSFAGDLKLGNFTLSFVDMTVPVSGIPITVGRTYDSMSATSQDDFGYGWRLEVSNTDLRTSVGKTGDEADGFFRAFRDNTRVYVTLPGGKREGFTFAPAGRSLFVATLYTPKFQADPGVTDTLTVSNIGLARFDDGTYGDFYGSLPYNPADPAFGGIYTLTTKEGVVYTIDGFTGKLRTVADRNGNTLTFTDAGIVSSAGKGVAFERDPQGRITAVVDPMGQKVTYRYDAAGNLVAVTDRADATTQFTYRTDRPHYLASVIDPLGRTGIRSEYDDEGRLYQVIDAAGHVVKTLYDPTHSRQTVYDQLGSPTIYEYDDRGNIVTEIDALGGVTKHTYDANNDELTTEDPLHHVTTRTYDTRGNVLTETDALGHVTRMTYDGFGNVLTATDPLGNTTTTAYDTRGNLLEMRDAAGKVTRFTYDASGNPLSMADSLGTLYQFTYDASGNVVSQTDALGNVTISTYDANSRLLTTTQKLTTSAGVRTLITKTEYDDEGRVVKVIDAAGGITSTTYNAAGQRIATVDALGRKTEYHYDDRGELVRTILPDGTSTTTEYDAAGHQVATIDAAGRRTEMHYDALGRLVETVYADATPGNAGDNPRTKTEYDDAGRVTATLDELRHRTQYEYDSEGRQVLVRDALGHETTTEYDAAGRATSMTDALGHTTRSTFDAAGRLVGVTYADGTTTSSAFDARGRLVGRTDQLGRTTRYEYDAADRLVAVVDALGQRTTYAYDELGDLVEQTDANGHATKYEYDGLGRRTATVLPLAQRSTTEYDAVGAVASTTDFNGKTTTYDYDLLGRLTAKHLPGGSAVTITYTPTGQRKTATDARGTTSYAYDERDRLTSRTDPDGTKISYTYDLAGNRTSVKIPAGTTTYTFDALNRTETVAGPGGGLIRYTYDAIGNLAKTERPNGTVETRTYDDLGRLLAIDDRAPGGALIESFHYTLAANGRRDAVVEQDGRTVAYTYDLLDRLIEERITNADHTTRTVDYTYDPVGNRKSRVDSAEGETISTYDANDRLLTETLGPKVTYYIYDANGNTLSRNTSAVDQALYEWDAENRMIGADVTDASGTSHTSYEYDIDGIRVASSDASGETRYLIDTVQPYAQVLEEYTSGGVIKVSYVHGNDLISQDRAGSTSYYHVDGLGSTRALTNASGIVTDRYIYDAFGRTIGQVGSTGNVYLFAGEQRDAATGLDYLRARYMNPATGRFASRDTFEGLRRNPITLHRYVYGNLSPTQFVDPGGRFGLAEVMLTVSTIGVLVSAARLMAIYSQQVPPPPNTQLTVGQCAVIKQMLAYEAVNGTWETALHFSNTAGDTPMGPEFDNKPVQTAAGVMDLDWYTDVMLFSGGAAGIPIPLGTHIAYGTYFAGKLAWNTGRKAIALYEGVETRVAWWFSDPKEATALRAYLNDYKTYASLFPVLPH
ncbi:putative Ig domain-containing protein [Aquisphaera insulae]|uniref:putative Ig domain-containing protein n=1 Tax=Aquisphaera insulae TaxID=2712864 RepID=UPI0013ED4F65|nr:putative Ig domain-containing protein [Aquisphaera insulae]